MKDLLNSVRRRVAGRQDPVTPDPFRLLELEARLGRLACEMDALSREPAARYARAHHALAATRAYDQTLQEACLLLELPVPSGTGPFDRMLAEASLVQAGLSW